jgi:tetratricopeptide (TPR) repeat protein
MRVNKFSFSRTVLNIGLTAGIALAMTSCISNVQLVDRTTWDYNVVEAQKAFDKKENQKAIELYNAALAAKDANNPKITPSEKAQVLSNLAALYYDTGDMVKAESAGKDALQICTASLSADDSATKDTVKNLTAIYTKLGKKAELKALESKFKSSAK